MAGRIPQNFINDLLGRVDIVDVIEARITLKKAGRNHQALCPFHNEKTPSFSVSQEKQFYHCFGCGVNGSALTFLMEHDRLEFVEAVETLARMAGVEVPREASTRPVKDHSELYDVLGKAARGYRSALRDSPSAIEYLKQRGLTGEVARDFLIGYAPDEWHTMDEAFKDDKAVNPAQLLEAGLLTKNDKGNVYDRFRGRIMFPIRDTRGRTIGFGGRVMGSDEGPKYLNSPETPVFSKGRELYGLYEARKALRRIERLLVVEGYMDVVALNQSGIANCVASLGTATTSEHFRKLYRYCEEVVCCFDGDAAGRQAAWRALENALPTLEAGRQLKFMFLPDGEDPDSMVRKEGKSAFLNRVGSAAAAIEYLFSQLCEGLDLSELDGQAKLVSLVMPFIKRVPDGVLKQLMQQRLETLTGFAADASGPTGEPAPGDGSGLVGPARTPEQRNQTVELTPLARRLLGHLLKDPSQLQRVSDAVVDLVVLQADEDVFAEIVKYVDNNPDADRSEIIGRWAGHAIHTTLTTIAQQSSDIPQEAVAAELEEGLTHYAARRGRNERRRLLDQVKENPTPEQFRRFWELKQNEQP